MVILSFLGCDVGHIFGVGWIEVYFLSGVESFFLWVDGWWGVEGLYFLLGLGSRIDFGIHAKL